MYRLINLMSVLVSAALLCSPYAVAAADRSGFDAAQRTQWHSTTGDFNGDGEIDYAWLELDDYGYCLLMAEVAGRQYVLRRSGRVCGGLYVVTLAPGVHATACAKGYGPACRPDELREVNLAHTGLLFGQQEASGQLWYWRGDGFSQVWLSD